MATKKSKSPDVDGTTEKVNNTPVQESHKEIEESVKKYVLLPDKEVNVAVSSRALFQLEQEHHVFETEGRKPYIMLQIINENQNLKPGSAFPFIQALEYVNAKLKKENPDEKELFVITLMSHNNGNVGIRLWKSINHYGLNVTGCALTSGSSMVQYLKAYEIILFLTSYENEVADALNNGFAAALMSLQPITEEPRETQLRIAFDMDVVLFSNENKGCDDGSKQHEDVPLTEGPLKAFAEVIGRMQKKLANVEPCPIRTYMVSSCNEKNGLRALITLRHWGLEIDETHFMGRRSTEKLLKVINPHIYFNNKLADVQSAREAGMPTGHVIKHDSIKTERLGRGRKESSKTSMETRRMNNNDANISSSSIEKPD